MEREDDHPEEKQADIVCSDPDNDIAVLRVQDVTLQLVSSLPHLNCRYYIN
jgi:hypothetical protein